MTRAKERLVLSGALTRRQSPGNFLALLKEEVGVGGVSAGPPPTLADDLISKTVIPAGVGKRAGGGRKKKDAAPRRELTGFEARWRAREDRWSQCRQRSLYLTPSSLPHPLEGAPQEPTSTTSPTLASAIGGLVHRALEDWSYRDTVEVLLEQLDRRAARWLPDEFKGNRNEILTEAREVLQAFARSDAYGELKGATILGREVPFLMPWPGPPPALMEGRIDLIYKRDGAVWLADYKTDRVTEANVAERAEAYGEQARIYTEAVRHALGHRPAGFKVIFLRLGQAVPVVL